ncbi:MAG TPA: SulP family inorganic anion transporter [Myxococcales bacterium]|jgi:high affinity sulfate transporter 1
MTSRAEGVGAAARRRLPKIFPVLDWSRGYRRSWLWHDLLAGVLGALASMPAAMGLAQVAGLPARAGLYVLVFPVLTYAVFGASREMVLSPAGAVAALIGETLLPLAAANSARQLELASLLSLMVAAMLLVAATLRLGVLQSFVSRPVLLGYLAGSAAVVALTQVGAILGARSEGRTAIAAVRALVASAGMVTPLRASFGLGCLAALLALRRTRLPIPGSAVLLLGAALLATLAGWSGRIEVLGAVGRSLPPLGVPAFDPRTVWAMLPGAVAILLVIVSDSGSIERGTAAEHGERVPPNHELAALGLTNLAAGLSGGFPVGGSVPDTAFGERAGGRTPLSGVVSALVVVAVLASGWLFERIPVAALGAVVFVAVLEAVAWRLPALLWRFDRREFAFMLTSFFGVLLVGFVPGLVVAVLVNIIVLLLAAVRVRLVELGTSPEAGPRFGDLERSPGFRPVPGVLILRVESGLYFINASSMNERVLERCARLPTAPRAVVLDLGTTPFVDFSGCLALERLGKDLAEQGVRLAVANPPGLVRDSLRRFGLRELLPTEKGRLDIPGALERLGLAAAPKG